MVCLIFFKQHVLSFVVDNLRICQHSQRHYERVHAAALRSSYRACISATSLFYSYRNGKYGFGLTITHPAASPGAARPAILPVVMPYVMVSYDVDLRIRSQMQEKGR